MRRRDVAVPRRALVWVAGAGSAAAIVLPHAEIKEVKVGRGGGVSSRTFVDVSALLDFADAPSRAAGADGFSVGAGSFVVGGHGLASDPRCPEVPGTVRGLNGPGTGFVLEASADGRATRVHYVIQVDLKGWLPLVVINRALPHSYEHFFADLAKELEKYIGVGTSREASESTQSTASACSEMSGRA